MKFAIGYQLPEPDADDSTVAIVHDFRDAIVEVYFPWVGGASGRAALGTQRGFVDWTAQARLEEDLAELRDMGVRLDLLFNANCYGPRAASEHLQNEVGSVLEHLRDQSLLPEVVTTTSLLIARTVKRYFPSIEIRASVNMRIGSPDEFSYVDGLFDSFYLRRDHQRDLAYVREVSDWAQENGKAMLLLANSGCLHSCPGQSFHDNMVAHDAEIDEMKNVDGWTPHVCWNIYRKPENWPAILRSTWIRPEDIHHYEDVVPMMKLATRMHSHPRRVVEAYRNGRYDGNLLDLFEPSHGSALAPKIIDNTRFPDDWFQQTSTCGHRCHRCKYCDETLEHVLFGA